MFFYSNLIKTWNTALIFSNKNHGHYGLQKKTLYRKKLVFCSRLCKSYWVTYCTHVTSHATWSIKTKTCWKSSLFNKFYIIFHFLSLFVFMSIQNTGRSIPLKKKLPFKISKFIRIKMTSYASQHIQEASRKAVHFIFKNSRPRCSTKKIVLNKFAKFTR